MSSARILIVVLHRQRVKIAAQYYIEHTDEIAAYGAQYRIDNAAISSALSIRYCAPYDAILFGCL